LGTELEAAEAGTGGAPPAGSPAPTVVILTHNEEVHVRRAVSHLDGWAADVFVVDSLSTDATREIAAEAGAQVYTHAFVDYASQREWALRELPYRTEWVLFLDADEMVSPEMMDEIGRELAAVPEGVDGFYVKWRFYWMGRWLRHGGVYPTWVMRLVRHRRARCDTRSVNEHVQVEGTTRRLSTDLLHVDLKPLSEWIAKHNRYATLEAREQVKALRAGRGEKTGRFFGRQHERKQWLRENVWEVAVPSLMRPFVWFAYAYVFRLGFLDGVPGLTFHLLQGFSYRLMIEMKFILMSRHDDDSVNPPGLLAGPAARDRPPAPLAR
jgi:glycosyltransferase involved in cell wall biosynthesis